MSPTKSTEGIDELNIVFMRKS